MRFLNKVWFLLLFIILTIAVYPQASKDSVSTSKKDTAVFVMQKSAWTAVGLSAVCPGLGQIYNGAYWKAPIVWGLTGWFLYNYIQANKDYKHYQNLYIAKGSSDYKRLRDDYHDQRDQFAVYMGLTYVLTLVDSYVDAHLFDFSVDEKFYRSRYQINMRIGF
jgi:hypothetical protein